MAGGIDVVVFDVSSDYAHFRRPYSTTSALSLAVPPKTALYGLIGAIIGLRSEGYMRSAHVETLSRAGVKVAVVLMGAVKKTRFQSNYLPMKARMDAPRIQVTAEYVKNPHYRMIVTAESDHILGKLEAALSTNQSFFTPCLGTANMIAKLSHVCSGRAEPAVLPVQSNSWVPVTEDLELAFEEGREYLREVISVEMDGNRRITRYAEIIYERRGKTVGVKKSSCKPYVVDVSGERCVFFPL